MKAKTHSGNMNNNYEYKFTKEKINKFSGNKKKITNFKQKYFPMNKLIFILLILIVFPCEILSQKHYIELKVGETGYQQILSNEFTGKEPSAVYVNNEVQMLRERKVYVESTNYVIKIYWSELITNFTYMFSNVININYAKMYYISGNNCNLSYMFYNCNNLKEFNYINYYNYSYLVNDTMGMFYNCSSLITFSFDNLYMNNYSSDWNCENYYKRNMSYMFYNCQSLKNISCLKTINYISDMRDMFYSCISLTSINLDNFNTTNSLYVNLSYMFYNCHNLSSFYLTTNLYVNDMNNMFNNCTSLEEIDFNSIKSSSKYYINVSRLFYNCIKLNKTKTRFYLFYISDTREMFFNCTLLKNFYDEKQNTIYINSNGNNNIVNMSKMFYNCTNLEKITIQPSNSEKYISVNDFNLIFYNCHSLTSIKLQNISIHYAKNMSYMFYNCKKLQYLTLDNIKYDSNSLVKQRTMKGMFQNCESITSLDLSQNFYTENVEIMWDMFKGCINLEYLNLSSFDTSQVTDMGAMFENCSSLTSLSLSSFSTSKVQFMYKMFYNCSKLTSLDFGTISANSLSTMHQMFYNCISLQYLNISGLTEKEQSIKEMFKGASTNFTFCIKENEDIPNIFQELFSMSETSRDCDITCYWDKSRIAIPSKKLCCKNVEYNGFCYDKCPKRTRVFNNNQICQNFSCPYEGINRNRIYYNYEQNDCIDKIPDGYFEDDKILKTIDKCHEDCATCEKRATDSSHTNCLSCKEDKKPYIYLGNCYGKCLNGQYTDEDDNIQCYCLDKKCLICPEESAIKGLCAECNKDYYKKASDIDKKYFNCFNKLDKYYLSNKLFYPCYNSCQTCDKEGTMENHNCLTCDTNNSFALKKEDYYNCYPNCTFYFYFDNNDNKKYTCSLENKCPDNYDLIIPELKQCVQNCKLDSDYYKYEFHNKCYTECPEDSEESEDEEFFCKLSCPFEKPFMLKSEYICVSNCTIIERKDQECVTNYFGNRTNGEIQDIILADIEENLLSSSFDYTIINNENIIIKEKDTNYELTTTNRKNTNKGASSLNLAECEKALREYYTIPNNKLLYILKYDVYIPGKEGPTVAYKVYSSLDENDFLEPLDLTICEGKQAIISYVVNITDISDLYNKDSAYYNDICVPYDLNDSVDMTLEDRQNNYKDNNKSLCEDNCKIVGYEPNTGMVDCSCEIKINLPLVSEISIDKNKLYNFINIKKTANFDVLKCYKLLMSKTGLIKNLGFYLFIPAFITFFVSIFIFYLKEFDQLKQQLDDIVYAKRYQKFIKETKKKPQEKIKLKRSEKSKKKKPKFVQPAILQLFEHFANLFNRHNNKNSKEDLNKKENNNNKNISYIKDNNLIDNEIEKKVKNKNKMNKDNKNKKKNAPPIKASINNKNKIKTKNLKNKNNSSSINILVKNKIKTQLITNNNNTKKFKSYNELSPQEKERIKRIMQFNESEMNEFTYKEAVKFDNRTYFQYYLSLIFTKQMILKICLKTDYNSRIIKLFLFYLNFCLTLGVTTLFFTDKTMHKIVLDEGVFNFIYQIPHMIYSAFITFILQSVINFFALSEESILNIKHEKFFKLVHKKADEVLRNLQIKFINFFIISFTILIIIWYYVACFCAVYKNTQFYLIKTVLSSFASSFAFPFGWNLVPGIFRIPSIKKHREYSYLLSKICQLF